MLPRQKQHEIDAEEFYRVQILLGALKGIDLTLIFPKKQKVMAHKPLPNLDLNKVPDTWCCQLVTITFQGVANTRKKSKTNFILLWLFKVFPREERGIITYIISYKVDILYII